jgi:hypothetical protein
MVKVKKHASITFAAAALASVVTSIAFLVFNSRPSADEYLTAPVLNGFYVDAPERKLFETSNNIFLNYLLGVKAIVSLGWDSFGNAATFQMIPAVMTNYFGPLASTLLAVVVHLVITMVTVIFARQLLKSNLDRIVFISVFMLSLFLAIIAGNYQTEQTFGIFTLTGIRFSSYLIQPLVLVLLVFMLIKEIVTGEVNRKRLSLFLIAFPMFVSLWTTMYLILLVPIVFAVTKLRKRNRSGTLAYWSKVYLVVLATAAFNASFVVFPTVNSGRSAAEEIGSVNTLGESALPYLLSEKAAIYFSGVLQTIVSSHSGVGLLAGILLSVFLGKRLVTTETIQIFTLSLFTFVLTLPIVFAFQELITYQAFWHKTSPVTYSFVLSFFLGLISTQRLKLRFGKPAIRLGLVSLSLLAAVAFVEVNHLREKVMSAGQALVAFRVNWDAGDPFGVGTSIENVEPYSILNFMQLTPYRHPIWSPPNEILRDVDLVFDFSSSQESSFAGDKLEVRANSSYFYEELGRRISFEFEVVDPSMRELNRRSISTVTVRDSTANIVALKTSRGLLIRGDIPLNKSVQFVFDGNCNMFVGNRGESCYKVINWKPGFSQEFSRIWKTERLSE